jgi:hypothetical protein
MAFKKAEKSQARLRLALFGPSGSGKTYTAMRLAAGLGGSVAVIDSERRSASKYADRFTFDVNDLDGHTIRDYIGAIREATAGGYQVLIIDSLTHAWQWLNEENERIAHARFKGNTWSAWSVTTPMQRDFIDAILAFPGHVICTMRSKTEWATSEGSNKTPKRIGLAPEQGKGIEYEFDLLLELSEEHYGRVLKDRTGKWQDVIIERPGEEMGAALAEWLLSGSAPLPMLANAPRTPAAEMPTQPALSRSDALAQRVAPPAPEYAPHQQRILDLLRSNGWTQAKFGELLTFAGLSADKGLAGVPAEAEEYITGYVRVGYDAMCRERDEALAGGHPDGGDRL